MPLPGQHARPAALGANPREGAPDVGPVDACDQLFAQDEDRAREEWKRSYWTERQALAIPSPAVHLPRPPYPNAPTERYLGGQRGRSLRVLWHDGFEGLKRAWAGAPRYEALARRIAELDTRTAAALRAELPAIGAELGEMVADTQDASLRAMVQRTLDSVGALVAAAEAAHHAEQQHYRTLAAEYAERAVVMQCRVSELRAELALSRGPVHVAEVAARERDRLAGVFAVWDDSAAPLGRLEATIAELAELHQVAVALTPLVAAYRGTTLPSRAAAAEWAAAARACGTNARNSLSRDLAEAATAHFDGIVEICATCHPGTDDAPTEPAALARLAHASREVVRRLQGRDGVPAELLELARRFENHWLREATGSASRHVWAAHLAAAALDHDMAGCPLPRPNDVDGWLARVNAAKHSAVYQAADARPMIDQALLRLQALRDTVALCGGEVRDEADVEAAPLVAACVQHLADLTRGSERSGSFAMAAYFSRGGSADTFAETKAWARRAATHYLAHWSARAAAQQAVHQAAARDAVRELEAAVAQVPRPTSAQVEAWRAQADAWRALPFAADAGARAAVELARAKLDALEAAVAACGTDVSSAAALSTEVVADYLTRAIAHRDALLAQLRQPGERGHAALWACRVAQHAVHTWRLAQQEDVGAAIYAFRNFAHADDAGVERASQHVARVAAALHVAQDHPLVALQAELDAENALRCARREATAAASNLLRAPGQREVAEALVITMRNRAAAWRASAQADLLASHAERIEVEADALAVTVLRAFVDDAVRRLAASAGVPSEAPAAIALAEVLRQDLRQLAQLAAAGGDRALPEQRALIAAEVKAGVDGWLSHHLREHAPVDGRLAASTRSAARSFVDDVLAGPWWQDPRERFVVRLDSVLRPASRPLPVSLADLDQEAASWPLYYFQPDLPGWAREVIGARLAAVQERLARLRPNSSPPSSAASGAEGFEILD